MKLAIVGSRSLNNYETVKNAVNSLCGTTEVTEVVSGGTTQGVDSFAERYASEHSIPTVIFKPDWAKYGKSAGFIRNKDIVERADFVLAVWDGESRGTLDSINHACKLGKPVKIVHF